MTRITLLCVFLAAAATTLLAPAPARAQPAPKPYTDSTVIPQTPAYRRALGLAELLNADDASRRREYLRGALAPDFLAQVPLEQHVAIIGEAGRSNGAIEVHAARSYEPPEPDTHAVLIVRSELLESWRAIVVDVEEAEPHRITGISFAPARPPSDQPRAARLTEGEIAERLGAYVDRLAGAERFSGTVLLAKDGEVLASRAVGLANRDFDVPVTMDTKFNLGSMNKMMTGIAVMQLVESGKLSLDDPISMHLSEDWLPGVDKSRVTVRHLLTHTSGLGSFFTEEWDRASRALYRSVDDWKPVVAAETLAFEPGTQSRYSNTGMLIAGAVVEHVSGQSYDEYVREHITGPAGMTDTGFFETDRVNKNLAVGYEPIPGADPVEYRNNLHQHVVKGGPAGGGYSTAPDLLKFDRALRSGRIVSRASLGQLWRAYPDLGSPNYGLGFGVFPTPAGLVVGHSGGFSGISADLSMYLDEGYTFIALANLGGAAGLIEQKARELITQGR